jgi:hypothetical protein
MAILDRMTHPLGEAEAPVCAAGGHVLENPKFIQGVFAFEGRGLDRPEPLRPEAVYKVPRDKRAQLIYFRAGNSSAEMVYVVLRQNERPMRYFPIGARSATHVPLAIVEDILPESRVELSIGAPEGVKGMLMLDIGLMEV